MAASSSIFSSEQARRLPWRAVALFIAILVVFDQGVGRLIEPLILGTDSNWGPNQVARLIQRREPGIILGNSRAGAISPKILRARTGVAFFNGTAPGQSIRYQLIVFEELLRRNPGLNTVIYELDHADLTTTRNSGTPVDVASFLYGSSDTAREIFHKVDWWNRVRFLSRTYRVNGAIVPVLLDRFFPRQRYRLTSDDGFMALGGSMKGKPCLRGRRVDPPFDKFKLMLLKRLVDRARAHSVSVMFVTAPLLLACSVDQGPLFARFAKLAHEWGVPYRSFLTATQAPADFHDQNHINRTAARRYSKWIADALAANISRGTGSKK